jgi:enoyl-CoA hydratase/carnithine racemase
MIHVYARTDIYSVDLIREFIMELVNCDKLLVGGLVGSVMGLGVAMLPYLDYVYASDKTTFCLPYGDLGQSYEGGLSFTLPLISKSLVSF